ncbi:hypothetical protein MTR_8g067020 [Medicago truncatula]|uniref:Uncharacterized protein n=1 Tax=Medicago truncatula TaxID=3880 RepID=A0A072TRP0_MEDTR|nr:hypothetical protein MTR_8g067020 [Medicago truncatula]
MNIETTSQLCKIQTKFHMATSKVLSIALFVLLGLSMCSATRKLSQEGSGGLPGGGGLPGVGSGGGLPGGGGLPVVGSGRGLLGGLVGGLPVVGGLLGPILGG